MLGACLCPATPARAPFRLKCASYLLNERNVVREGRFPIGPAAQTMSHVVYALSSRRGLLPPEGSAARPSSLGSRMASWLTHWRNGTAIVPLELA